MSDNRHPSHVTRVSDASSFDEVCDACGATDIAGGGWGKLAEPCPAMSDRERREAYRRGQRAMQDRAARLAADEDGAISVWGENRNTAVAQKTCQDIAAAIRAVALDDMSDTERAPTPPADARLAEIRERVEDVIVEGFGERCPDFDPTCMTCKVWAALDDLGAVDARRRALIGKLERRIHNQRATLRINWQITEDRMLCRSFYGIGKSERLASWLNTLARARQSETENARLAARVKELEGALEPFGSVPIRSDLPDDAPILHTIDDSGLIAGHFRAARAALQPEEEGR